jgi:hypothetical protein
MTDAQIQEYEDIRNLRMIGIHTADRGCRKLHMGQVPFSDKYRAITDRIELWKAVTTKKRHCRYSQSKLCQLEKKTGIYNLLHCTLEEAKLNEQQAYEEYWRFKKSARVARDTFLETKAKQLSKESSTSTKNIIKQIITREKQREASRQIKATLHKIRKTGITKVEIETENGVEEITTKRGMFESIVVHILINL